MASTLTRHAPLRLSRGSLTTPRPGVGARYPPVPLPQDSPECTARPATRLTPSQELAVSRLFTSLGLFPPTATPREADPSGPCKASCSPRDRAGREA